MLTVKYFCANYVLFTCWLIVYFQVDEKCVPSGSNSSNFFHLDHHFLQHVSMPWYNVHTMPVDVAGHLCHPELMGE